MITRFLFLFLVEAQILVLGHLFKLTCLSILEITQLVAIIRFLHSSVWIYVSQDSRMSDR